MHLFLSLYIRNFTPRVCLIKEYVARIGLVWAKCTTATVVVTVMFSGHLRTCRRQDLPAAATSVCHLSPVTSSGFRHA